MTKAKKKTKTRKPKPLTMKEAMEQTFQLIGCNALRSPYDPTNSGDDYERYEQNRCMCTLESGPCDKWLECIPCRIVDAEETQ